MTPGGLAAIHEEMAHEHDHAGHSHAPPADFGWAFAWGVGLNATFIVFEIVFGILSSSLALLADAGHNFADVIGLIMAWIANSLAKKAASSRRTYGWKRSTVLAALFNAILLLVGVGAIFMEAVTRLREPTPVAGGTVIWVSALGILVNGATALIFMSGRKQDLNVRGAFLHMAADAGVSAGVMISGAVILFTQWVWLDPIVSMAVAFFILLSTWELLVDSLNLSLDAVPEHIDPDAVRAYLGGLPEVADVHHVHIWPLSTTETALTAHLVKRDPSLDDDLIARIKDDLFHKFRIGHPTIQFEMAKEPQEPGDAP